VYPIFTSAARHWLAGADVYPVVANPYRYSPLVTTLLVPFGLLPDRLAEVVWRVLNAAVYLVALSAWSKVVLPHRLTRCQQAWLFLLVVPMSVGSLNNGQSNPLVLGLLLTGIAGVARERWNGAAACIALASLFKVYPIAVGLLLAAVYPRRFAGRLLVAIGIGLALPFVLQRPAYVWAQYQGWWQQLQHADRNDLPLDQWYRDLRLLCQLCRVPLSQHVYAAIQVTAAAGFAAICLAGRWAGWPSRRLLTTLTGLGCCWMTLLGPTTESCTYIFLAPTLAWKVLESWLYHRWPVRITFLASYGLFTVSNAAVWFPAGRQLHTLGIQPLAALLLLICLLVTELHPWRVAGGMWRVQGRKEDQSSRSRLQPVPVTLNTGSA
jgi:hypothetical protein